ncbi:MAG: molybdopterin-dependent oxidoreductase, partial [Bacillota bacterium]|nr:molybdopterin-dependent oxidoreductase [Bacillota bacterium]
MVKETKKTGCPLNCIDGCQLIVTVAEGKIVKVQGGLDNPHTKGFTCSKASLQVQRTESSERILYPMYRENRHQDQWQRITWQEAYELLAEKLATIKETWGSESIYHHYDFGSNG